MNKIVVRTPNHLGDCLMALPAMEALARELPDDEITLMMPKWAVVIYNQVKSAKFIPVGESGVLHGRKAIAMQKKILRSERFDIGLLLTPSFSSALIYFLGGVKERYGYSGEGRRILLNHGLKLAENSGVHRSMKYARLVEFFLDRKIALSRPILQVSPFSITMADKIIDEFRIDRKLPIIAIAPRAVAPARRWGTDNYAALSDFLVRRYDGQIVLLGSSDDYSSAAEVVRNNRRIFNLCGKTDIGSVAGVLSQSALFIGNDSGLAHLAAAIDRPIVVLSGADNPAETSPISSKKTVIIKNHLECISCVKNICPLKEDAFMRCMKEITVEEVFAAARNYLEQYHQ